MSHNPDGALEGKGERDTFTRDAPKRAFLRSTEQSGVPASQLKEVQSGSQ